MKTFRLFALAIVAMMLLSQSSRSADHIDSPINGSLGGPGAILLKPADLTDVFAWMSPNAQKVNFIFSLGRNVQPAEAKFLPDTALQYVLHTTSRQNFSAAPGPEVKIICTFSDGASATAQTIQCWVGTEAYVTGNASNPATGITSADGKLHVFAGLRNDAFFFNLPGFRAVARTVAGALAGGTLQFDAAGCPQLDTPTVIALVTQLQSRVPNPNPGPPAFLGANNGTSLNDFNGFNLLAIVLEVDKSLVTKNGPLLSVWGSTNRP